MGPELSGVAGTRSVAFRNQRGQRLAGVLHGDVNEVAAISCHGMLSTKNGTKHVHLAQELSGRGIATLRFDFAGLGESDGDIFEMTYTSEMEDLAAAVEYLVELGASRVGVFGSSMGGAVALLAAARDERIVAVATLAAVAHPQLIEERHPEQVRAWHQHGYIQTEAGRIGPAFCADALAHNVLSAVHVLRAPVLAVHGERDTVVPPSDAHDIATAARSASLEMVPGADHMFSNPVHMRPAMTHIADFLSNILLCGSRPDW